MKKSIIKKMLPVLPVLLSAFFYYSYQYRPAIPARVTGETVSANNLSSLIKMNMDKTVSIISEAEPSTLQGMKEKYGKIDVITLFNGRVINGIIKSRGDTFTILTTDGIMHVKAGHVMKTARLKGM